MAADDVAKGALQLIKWGKKLAPATVAEIAEFGPQADRVKSYLHVLKGLGSDAKILSNEAYGAKDYRVWEKAMLAAQNSASRALHDYQDGSKFEQRIEAMKKADEAARRITLAPIDKKYLGPQKQAAAQAEVLSDVIFPNTYRTLTDPVAVARRFELTVPNAPEGFTNAARTLSERGLVSAPKDIELARRISMLPPHLQDVYFSLLQDGSDPVAMLTAMKLLG